MAAKTARLALADRQRGYGCAALSANMIKLLRIKQMNKCEIQV